jgi:hypothetical protein
MTCSKPRCHARAFMDSDRCFDHQHTPAGFTAFTVLALTFIIVWGGVLIWAVISLVRWVTSQ